MIKLGRNYTITFSGANFPTPLVVGLPFTIEFDITRNTLTSANVCQIRLYNLSLTNRNALRRNVTNTGPPYTSIVLRAGYGDNLPVIFSGNISQAWNVREGVNFISQIECFDGGFAFVNAQVPANLSNIPAGTPYRNIIINLIKSLPNVTLGAVGKFPGSTPRAAVYSGNTIDVLRYLTGGAFFIDKGIGNALVTGEYALSAGPPNIINAASGLLNTPVLEQTSVRFDMMFEPLLDVGSGVTLTSITEADFNGFYTITSVKHRGMISQSVCGEVITTGEFFFVKVPTAVPRAN